MDPAKSRRRLRAAYRLKIVPSSPLVSLVLSVKNAMPQVRLTMEALQRQTYRNFEVVVQDGASTDGTVEYLSSVSGFPRIEIASQPDTGIGQAYNRGLARSTGDIVCFIAADEYLDDDALEKGVQWFLRHPHAAVVFGGMRLLDAAGRLFQTFIPPPWDWMKIIHNEVAIPMAAAFLNRKILGPDLYYDESLKTCPDYDFWLRVGSKLEAAQFVLVPEPILTARADRTSMSFRAESFPQFSRDKLFILNRFLGAGENVQALKTSASAGILAWAAENVLRLEGVSPEFLTLCRQAAQFDPHAVRLSELARKSEAFEISSSGEFLLKPPPQPHTPQGPAQSIDGLLKLEDIHAKSWWNGAQVEHGTPTRVTTAPEPWSYSALIPLTPSGRRCWAKLNLQVRSGEVGISLFAADTIYNEQTIAPEHGRLDVFIRISEPGAAAVMIRNGSQPGASVAEIFDATVVS
jgi:Glycosyl transferase family 2